MMCSCAQGAQGGQRRKSDPLELKTGEVVSHLTWYYDSNPSLLEVLLIAEAPLW